MRIEKKLGTDSYYHLYPSTSALLSQEHYPINDEFMRNSVTHSGRGQNWFGVDSYEAVLEALSRGWPEGTAQMREALSAVALPKIPSVKRKLRRDKQGDYLDIHRVYRGDFDRAWDVRKREQSLSTSGSHLTIAVDVGCNAYVSAQDAMWRGASAVALAEAAQESGRAVRIVCVCASRNPINLGGSSLVQVATEVKTYHQRVSTDVLMTYCSLPGFFRAMYFKAYCSADPDHPVASGLGTSINFDRALLEDGSKMVWIGRDTLSPQAAQKAADNAVQMMVNRVGESEYRKTA